MTNFKKWLGGMGISALAGVMVFGAAGISGASEAEAQSPPAPPSTFGGTVEVDGDAPAVGTPIEAHIDGNICGTSAVGQGNVASNEYSIQVDAAATEAGCGEYDDVDGGSTVVFYVGGEQANETGEWASHIAQRVDLTVTTPVDDVDDTPVDDVDDTPVDDVDDTPVDDVDDTPVDDVDDTPVDDVDDTTPVDDHVAPTATPGPPETGSGAGAAGTFTAAWFLAALGLGAAGFGAAGAIAARRSS